MGRWEPDAPGRLLRAALDLFGEQGYDATTSAQIAARAGLTKTTLFRHFDDKREILFQGQPAMVAVVTSAVQTAPTGTDAFDLARVGLTALCDAHVPEQQEIGRQIERIVAASSELQERTAFKRAALTGALEAALRQRLDDPPLAGVVADLGIRAYYQGFSAWTGMRPDDALLPVVLGEFDALEQVLGNALTRRTG